MSGLGTGRAGHGTARHGMAGLGWTEHGRAELDRAGHSSIAARQTGKTYTEEKGTRVMVRSSILVERSRTEGMRRVNF